MKKISGPINTTFLVWITAILISWLFPAWVVWAVVYQLRLLGIFVP